MVPNCHDSVCVFELSVHVQVGQKVRIPSLQIVGRGRYFALGGEFFSLNRGRKLLSLDADLIYTYLLIFNINYNNYDN